MRGASWRRCSDSPRFDRRYTSRPCARLSMRSPGTAPSRATRQFPSLRILSAALTIALSATSPSLHAGDSLAHQLATLKTNDERTCLLAESGGYTPALRDALGKELHALRTTKPFQNDPRSPSFWRPSAASRRTSARSPSRSPRWASFTKPRTTGRVAETLYEEAAARGALLR